MAVADEMKHHPHIAKTQQDDRRAVTVSCTIHNPRGLSVRDTKVAGSVDQEARGIDHDYIYDPEMQQKLVAINRAAIDKALQEQQGECFAPL